MSAQRRVEEARSRDLGRFMLDALSPHDDSLTAERLRAAYLCGMTDFAQRIRAEEEPCYKLFPINVGLPDGSDG